MIIFIVGMVIFLWLVLSFVDLPIDRHKFDAVKYWNEKEQKWAGTVQADPAEWGKISQKVLEENKEAWNKLAKE